MCMRHVYHYTVLIVGTRIVCVYTRYQVYIICDVCLPGYMYYARSGGRYAGRPQDYIHRISRVLDQSTASASQNITRVASQPDSSKVFVQKSMDDVLLSYYYNSIFSHTGIYKIYVISDIYSTWLKGHGCNMVEYTQKPLLLLLLRSVCCYVCRSFATTA